MKKLLGILVCNVYLFGMVDVNHASVKQLVSLNGIGEIKAKRIVDYRKQNGCFKNINHLSNVKGISQKTILKNKANIKIISCQ